jgi:nitrous oxide reductase accessory protein NosL
MMLCPAAFTACEPLRSWVSSSDRCVLSQREIHPGMAVRVEAVDGPSGRACCLRCAITYSRQTGKTVRVDWVTDHAHGREIAADRAVYVVGSNAAPCAAAREVAPAGRRELLTEIWDRCRTSTIAFADVADARAFQEKHAGAIETFAELVRGEKVVRGSAGGKASGERR